jgi:acetylornithine aminotransferase
VLRPGEHGSTFGGNPFACGVAMAVCQTIEQENLLENVRSRGKQLRKGLKVIANKYPDLCESVRGWGLINGLVLNPESGTAAIDIVKAALEKGLLLIPAGTQVVRLIPPLIVSEADVEKALSLIDETLSELSS